MDDGSIVVAGLERLGATDIRRVSRYGGAYEFTMAGSRGVARQSASGRIRGHILIGPWHGAPDPYREASIWLSRQATPLACQLLLSPPKTADRERGFAWVRAFFDRPLELGRIAVDDPLPREVAALNEAYRLRELGVRADLNVGGTFVVEDPGMTAPANAWLVSGYPRHWFWHRHLAEARRAAASGIFDHSCPANPGVRRGDLLFCYITTPFKAVHFVTRAAGDAYETMREQDDGSFRKRWLVEHAPPVPVRAVPLEQLRRLTGKKAFRGVQRLDPEQTNLLIELIGQPRNPDDAAEFLWVLQPVGSSEPAA